MAAVTEPEIASKVANALIEDAQGSQGHGHVVDSLDWLMDRFRRHYGGVWVGGRLTLTDRTLTFVPNAVNRVANTGVLDIEIDLAEVTGPVTVLPGFVTKIIAVPVGGAVFKARCWGAKKMAERIQAAVARLVR
jgi:hypothetical protein